MESIGQVILIPGVENASQTGPNEIGEHSFSQIVEEFQVPIFNLCYRMLGEREEAEDATQETFVRAYLHARRYDSERSLKTWLFSIAHHHCIDLLRKRRRIAWFSLDAFEDGWTAPDRPASPRPSSPEEVLLRREDQRYLQRLLASLKPELRAAIILRYWFDFSVEEIAQASDCSISAVKSRLFRARKELANLYAAAADRARIGTQAAFCN